MGIKAVIFDLGGVVYDSPMGVFARHEAQKGLPPNFLNRLIVNAGPDGAWAKLERGELDIEVFYSAFDAELAEAGADISSRELMSDIDGAGSLRPSMVKIIRRLRSEGYRVAALTNNWILDHSNSGRMDPFKSEFDVFIESCKVGLRKPDPDIYRLACQELGVSPGEAVFLDDIGRNLKPARQLGMTTIKVTDPRKAVRDLEEVLGMGLLETQV